MNSPVELLHVLSCARELGDPVEGALDLLGTATLCVHRLEFRQSSPCLGELGRKVDLGSHRGPVTAAETPRRRVRTRAIRIRNRPPSRLGVSCVTTRSSRLRTNEQSVLVRSPGVVSVRAASGRRQEFPAQTQVVTIRWACRWAPSGSGFGSTTAVRPGRRRRCVPAPALV
jgi:hypothetical protein